MKPAAKEDRAKTQSGARARAVVRVLVVEDEPAWVERIQRALEHIVDLELVKTGAAAKKELSSSAKYDLVILDLGLPDIDGLELLRWMRRGIFAGRVIVYTVRGNPHTIHQIAMIEGVRTLIKPADDTTIQECVASCITTPDRIDAAVAEFVAEYDLSPRAGDDSRVADVLRERAHGLKDVQVCEKLGISDGTYRSHRGHILAKTRDDSLDELVIRILLRAAGLG